MEEEDAGEKDAGCIPEEREDKEANRRAHGRRAERQREKSGERRKAQKDGRAAEDGEDERKGLDLKKTWERKRKKGNTREKKKERRTRSTTSKKETKRRISWETRRGRDASPVSSLLFTISVLLGTKRSHSDRRKPFLSILSRLPLLSLALNYLPRKGERRRREAPRKNERSTRPSGWRVQLRHLEPTILQEKRSKERVRRNIQTIPLSLQAMDTPQTHKARDTPYGRKRRGRNSLSLCLSVKPPLLLLLFPSSASLLFFPLL